MWIRNAHTRYLHIKCNNCVPGNSSHCDFISAGQSEAEREQKQKNPNKFAELCTVSIARWTGIFDRRMPYIDWKQKLDGCTRLHTIMMSMQLKFGQTNGFWPERIGQHIRPHLFVMRPFLLPITRSEPANNFVPTKFWIESSTAPFFLPFLSLLLLHCLAFDEILPEDKFGCRISMGQSDGTHC